ncbi:MAG TPA: WYL domain-containing protein, partial [Chloroflexi bacterium]|nr:WYL domain-containing protein [Chloroflexota bacterium]
RLLDRLFATQPPWQQALLQAQYERLIDLLADLLDNLPFTPPPTPTDPAQWQAIIHTAIEQKQPLQITYFSAGRNLSTQRRIEPYWIEERRGIPYLRAYCHSAARVLTFRLDRIQAIAAASRSPD